MTDKLINELHADEVENGSWHDLDDCMTAFIGRLSPLQQTNDEDHEYLAAVQYYIALDLALWDDSKTRLALLLKKRTPIPPEFLPLLSDILLGKNKKGGRPKHFSSGQEIHLYLRMCKLHYGEKKPLSNVFAQMCDQSTMAGMDVDTQTMERLWKRCESDERLKRVFGRKGQNPT